MPISPPIPVQMTLGAPSLGNPPIPATESSIAPPRFSFSNSFAIASTISGCISPQNLRVMWMVFGATHLIPAPAAFFAASHSPRASMCSGGSFTQMNVRRSLPASGGIQLPIISCLRRTHLRRRIFLSGRQGPVQRSAGGRPPCLLQIGGETPPCRSLS